jgi:glutaredoxin
MTHSPLVRLYSRPDCHLCDEARAGLEAMLAEGLDFRLEEVDIDSDDELHRRYLERIPVVELQDEVVSELALDVESVKARLATVSA